MAELLDHDLYPEIKFTDLLCALTKFEDDEAKSFWDNVANRQYHDLEKITLTHCHEMYMPWQQVEHLWLRYMENAIPGLKGIEKVLSGSRNSFALHGSRSAGYYFSRSVDHLLPAGGILVGISTRYEKVLGFGGATQVDLLMNLKALTEYNLHWDIARFSLNHEIFDCVLDDFHQCSASTRSCKVGHTHVQQFSRQKCRAREYVDQIITLRRNNTENGSARGAT